MNSSPRDSLSTLTLCLSLGLNYNVADQNQYFFLARKMTTSNLKKLWRKVHYEEDLLPSYSARKSFPERSDAALYSPTLFADSIDIVVDRGAAFAARLEPYKHLHGGCSANWLYSLCESATLLAFRLKRRKAYGSAPLLPPSAHPDFSQVPR